MGSCCEKLLGEKKKYGEEGKNEEIIFSDKKNDNINDANEEEDEEEALT